MASRSLAYQRRRTFTTQKVRDAATSARITAEKATTRFCAMPCAIR